MKWLNVRKIQITRRLNLIQNIMIPEKLKIAECVDLFEFHCFSSDDFLLFSTNGRLSTDLKPYPSKGNRTLECFIYKVTLWTCLLKKKLLWKVIWWICLLKNILLWKMSALSLLKKTSALLFLASLNGICYLNRSKQWNIGWHQPHLLNSSIADTGCLPATILLSNCDSLGWL